MEKYNTEEILRESQENVKKLNEKLKDIESLHNEIKESVSLSLKNPELFKELAAKLNESAELYLIGNNTIFDKKIYEISNKINELGSEITRLVEVDFHTLFKGLETKFLDNSKVELAKELLKFDDKINKLDSEINRLVEVDFNVLFKDLQTKFLDSSKIEIAKELAKFDARANTFIEINETFKVEIERLSNIDLEEHFNKHQNKLSEVFISVNGINGILTTISQNINTIIKNFGDVEQTLSKNQKEIIKSFEVVKENQEKITNDLLIKLNKSDTKLDSIITDNEALKKQLDFNKKLNIAVIILIIISFIIMFMK